MGAIYDELRRALQAEQLVALATVIVGPGTGAKLLLWPDGRSVGGLGTAELDARVREQAAGALEAQRSERLAVDLGGGQGVEVFIDVHPPAPKLIVIGAVHIAIALVSFAKILGFRTIVVDPRAAFATPERFGHADQLLLKWPDEAFAEIALNEASYVVSLSHDAKLDNPALQLALDSPARYVGAIGSRKTHQKRVHALRELGLSDQQIDRIHAPIGLNLGGRRAEEVALSILAEIVAVRQGVEPAHAGSLSRVSKA
jgi:xanthine dehydrogenase accessory factor